MNRLTIAEVEGIEKRVAEGVPFSLTCSSCDQDGPATPRRAMAEGWVGVEEDDGPTWNWLGLCHECAKELDNGRAT